MDIVYGVYLSSKRLRELLPKVSETDDICDTSEFEKLCMEWQKTFNYIERTHDNGWNEDGCLVGFRVELKHICENVVYMTSGIFNCLEYDFNSKLETVSIAEPKLWIIKK